MTDQPNDAERIEILPLTGIHAEPFSIRKLITMMRYFGPAATWLRCRWGRARRSWPRV